MLAATSLALLFTWTAPNTLTVCTGNRCWRNGAQHLLQAAIDECANTEGAISVRPVGCSGVCPHAAVSVCEGPDCAGDASSLPAMDEFTATASAQLAVAALRRSNRPQMMSTSKPSKPGGGRLKVRDLKQRLEAAGVSTAGIVEKEELERLLEELDGEALVDATSDVTTLTLEYMMGCAYAVLDGMRLLVDTGSAVSIVSSTADALMFTSSGSTKKTLRSRQDPSIELHGFSVASPMQQLPPQVDGILGFDCLRTYEAAEFDWMASKLRLYRKRPSYDNEDDDSNLSYITPFYVRRVSAGELPFASVEFGARRVEGLIDTGTPVTMVTPELANACQMTGTPSTGDDIITTGVDGQPTRMRASICGVIKLGESGERITHLDSVVYAGTCPMMTMAGWKGTEAALLGLDLLRSGVRSGQPKAAASGGPKVGRLLLDFTGQSLVVFV